MNFLTPKLLEEEFWLQKSLHGVPHGYLIVHGYQLIILTQIDFGGVLILTAAPRPSLQKLCFFNFQYSRNIHDKPLQAFKTNFFSSYIR